MTNNDYLRRLRFIFQLNDKKVADIFKLAQHKIDISDIPLWLKKDEDKDFKEIKDIDFAAFLNGFINLKRGKKEGAQPKPEHKLNNNIVLRKLKIALNWQDDNIIKLLESVNFRIGRSELSAFFRKEDNRHYRACQSQLMRNLFRALQQQQRPDAPVTREKIDSQPRNANKPQYGRQQIQIWKPKPKTNKD
ncbi:DUF1456 family protein [Paraferrimonas sp. SM1919]|uniref:DUF1456 family protein n=1 Tax=Paraferrimonas sp. SM1919 TaxID=2662263 RepID=UPI0013D3BBFD